VLLDFAKAPRHEFIDARGGMACRDGFKRCLEIGVWLDVVEFTGLDERRNTRPGSAAFIMAREQRVFSVEGNGAYRAFDDVAVHLDGAVIKEQLQAVHVFCNVAELLTQARFGGDTGALNFKPNLKVIHQRLGLLQSCGLALFSRLPLDRFLNLVELCDTLEYPS
jgi:hypothetical protein